VHGPDITIGMNVGRTGSNAPPGVIAAETLTRVDVHSQAGTARALHVTGPTKFTRHILPEGLVSLGRDATSTVVVDDPRVSWAHVALHVGETITVTDLGSASGTFLECRGLAPHEPTEVALDEAFSIGDSTLVVRATSLARTSGRRVSTWEQVQARRVAPGSTPDSNARLAFVRVHGLRRGGADGAEAILGELLVSPYDWLMRPAANEVWLGMETDVGADEPRTRRAIWQRLASWGVRAEVEAVVVSGDELARAAGDPRPVLAGQAPLELNRGPVVFQAPAMVALKRTLARVAPATVNVLVLGETGAGKDIVASLLHELSPRARRPFVGFNCASFPDSLLESELFGHERGAFTGATSIKPGLLETAEGGTVFLDEIGELSPSIQAKLLRVLESCQVTRLGGLASRHIDVRFVAATNRDLGAEVGAGRFRRDLFFRLNTVTVTVPPLRERRTEIEPLARAFLASARTRFNLSMLDFAPGAIDALEAHDWPGNVRELRNAIERAALLATGDLIEPAHLPLTMLEPEEGRTRTTIATPVPARARAPGANGHMNERERIERALTDNAGNQSRAAAALRMSRRTLVRKLPRLGIPRPRR
jgi:two-component system response regulator AtoC